MKSIGQYAPDFGVVKADSTFKEDYNFKVFSLPSILLSTNELEIRLSTVRFPKRNYDLIILSYHNGKWDAKKYTSIHYGGNSSKLTTTSFEIPGEEESLYNFHYKRVYDSLKANNIFQICYPAQSRLVESTGNDGTGYAVTYKVGNRFRNFGFSNPDTHDKMNPEVKEFKQYLNIVRWLNSLF